MKHKKKYMLADLFIMRKVMEALIDPDNADLLMELCARSGLEGLAVACDEETEDK